MSHQRILLSLLVPFFIVGAARAESPEEQIAVLRAGFVEVGRRDIVRSHVPEDQQRQLPSAYEACLPLLKAPPEILREAIDRGIRGGDVEERIGALEVYALATNPPGRRFPRRPEYQSVLVDLLKQDDQQVAAYTGVLIDTVRDYRSPETVLAFLDTVPRTTDPVMREALLRSAAILIGLDVPIYKQTTPLQEERILADLEAWLNRNRDRIRYNKNGQLYLAGGEVREGRVELTPEDRGRIRKEPVCVLKPIRTMMDGEEEDGVSELSARCGEALVGKEGTSLMRKGSRVRKGRRWISRRPCPPLGGSTRRWMPFSSPSPMWPPT